LPRLASNYDLLDHRCEPPFLALCKGFIFIVYFIYLFIFVKLGFELGLPLEPLHQLFFCDGFFQELFAWAGFEPSSNL
jgi:hypothetical protein